MKMNKLIKRAPLAGILTLALSCVPINVSRHPDYNFSPTKPATVLIYDRLEPNYPYLIIGRISINPNWGLTWGRVNSEIRRRAAGIGEDAVIITDVNVDIVAFNRGVTTEGVATVRGNRLYYYAVTRPNTLYAPVSYLYGYIIKLELF